MTELMERDGLVLGMSEDEYHGVGEYKQFATAEFSSTAAKEILKSAAHYAYAYRSNNPRIEKKAWDIGTATHTKVLGVGSPAVAYPEEVLSASGAANTNAAREWRAEQEAAGNIVVKQAELDSINAMTESVLAHPLARALFEQAGEPEASMFATDPETGLRLRCRWDYMPDDRRAGVDLKTTRDASPSGFSRLSHDLGYHVSRAHYKLTAELVGQPIDEMVFVVVQNTAPYITSVYQLEEPFAARGERQARLARQRLLECLTTDTWPAYSDELIVLREPAYAMYQDETENS